MKQFFSKHYYAVFQTTLFIIFLLPILAPILNHFGLSGISKSIYLIYSYSCHQFAHRSLHIYDEQCAWCARDTFIWGGMVLASVLASKFDIKEFKFYWLAPFIIPIALDGGIQTIASVVGLGGEGSFYTSTNFMRAVTGGIFGLGMGMFLSSLLRGGNLSFKASKDSIKYFLNKVGKSFVIGFAILAVFYIGFIQVWDITSKEVKPANALDLEVKTPPGDAAWQRQLDGPCKPDVPKSAISGGSITDFIFLPSDCY